MHYEKSDTIPIKELTKDLINGQTVFNGTKYFSSKLLRNYFIFIPTKRHLRFFINLFNV